MVKTSTFVSQFLRQGDHLLGEGTEKALLFLLGMMPSKRNCETAEDLVLTGYRFKVSTNLRMILLSSVGPYDHNMLSSPRTYWIFKFIHHTIIADKLIHHPIISDPSFTELMCSLYFTCLIFTIQVVEFLIMSHFYSTFFGKTVKQISTFHYFNLVTSTIPVLFNVNIHHSKSSETLILPF